MAVVRRRARHRSGWAALLIMIGAWAYASDSAPTQTADPLFASDTVLELELAGSIRALLRTRRDDSLEHPARLSWRANDIETGSLDIQVRARGNSRRRREVCEFPPLRLNLPRGDAAGTLFAQQDKLKLVTHCERLGSRDAAQHDFVWLEYLAYRFLGTLTDASFRVRAVEVTYVQEDGRRFTHPGFLIESRERLAHRLGLSVSEAETVASADMDLEHRALMDVFEYMIGNTDYSFRDAPGDARCCHNAVQLVDAAGRHYPVPYDFDRTGLLNKPGVRPPRGVGVDRVTERRYLGVCRSAEEIRPTLERFREARPAFEALLAAQADIRPRKRALTERFLAGFWETLDDPDRIARAFTNGCG